MIADLQGLDTARLVELLTLAARGERAVNNYRGEADASLLRELVGRITSEPREAVGLCNGCGQRLADAEHCSQKWYDLFSRACWALGVTTDDDLAQEINDRLVERIKAPTTGTTDLRDMQRINGERSDRWMAGTPGWTVLEVAGELCGEAGELANVCKKLRRSQMGVPGNKLSDAELLTQARGELGDVLIVLMLVASKLGIDLQSAVSEAFNAKSEQMGFPERFAERALVERVQTPTKSTLPLREALAEVRAALPADVFDHVHVCRLAASGKHFGDCECACGAESDDDADCGESYRWKAAALRVQTEAPTTDAIREAIRVADLKAAVRYGYLRLFGMDSHPSGTVAAPRDILGEADEAAERYVASLAPLSSSSPETK